MSAEESSQSSISNPTPPEVHLLIIDFARMRALLQSDADGLRLPRGSNLEGVTGLFGTYLRSMKYPDVAGYRLNMLYCAYCEPQPQIRALFVGECANPEQPPPEGPPDEGWRWLDEAELLALPGLPEFLRPAISQVFYEYRNDALPEKRSPWAVPGWAARAQTWILHQLTTHGLTLAGELEVIKKWCLTCVFRVPTAEAGDLYFKAVPPVFSREVGIMLYLAQHYAHLTPEIVASNIEERWLLMRDYQAKLLPEYPVEHALWEKAVAAYGDLQRQFSTQLEAVAHLKLLDYRHAAFSARVHDFFYGPDAFVADFRVSQADLDRLRAYEPRMQAVLNRLAECGLPDTLLHCDFHPGNIVASEERDQVIFFDWTDASIGHPFIDVALLLSSDDASSDDGDLFKDQAERREHLVDIYLRALAPHLSLDRLREAFKDAQIVRLIHAMVHYHWLMQALEPVDSMELNITSYIARQLLHFYETEATQK